MIAHLIVVSSIIHRGLKMITDILSSFRILASIGGLAEIGRYCVILVQPFLLHINRRLYAYSSESPRFKHSLCAGLKKNCSLYSPSGKGYLTLFRAGEDGVVEEEEWHSNSFTPLPVCWLPNSHCPPTAFG